MAKRARCPLCQEIMKKMSGTYIPTKGRRAGFRMNVYYCKQDNAVVAIHFRS